MPKTCKISVHLHEVDSNLISVNEKQLEDWIGLIVDQEGFELNEISFVFCTDDHLLNLNQTYLQHDTLTDIITFNFSKDRALSGECYISLERVQENAKRYAATFLDELHRVMVHGVLHMCGYGDKSELEKKTMRSKEDSYLALRI